MKRENLSHRYSNASVHTLRDGGVSPSADNDAPPLPVSRGTDGTYTRAWHGSVGMGFMGFARTTYVGTPYHGIDGLLASIQ